MAIRESFYGNSSQVKLPGLSLVLGSTIRLERMQQWHTRNVLLTGSRSVLLRRKKQRLCSSRELLKCRPSHVAQEQIDGRAHPQGWICKSFRARLRRGTRQGYFSALCKLHKVVAKVVAMTLHKSQGFHSCNRHLLEVLRVLLERTKPNGYCTGYPCSLEA